MENILFVLFLLKKDVICTEIIIFATEIRKHMMNIAGRNSKENNGRPRFLLLYGQDVRMGTVAENGNGCGNGCKEIFMKNT